ncbi:GDSL-type esterase/lipase family protein [Nocardia sp. NPDC058633]|uniref:GDSL-type esterase/lipase family protein n=1 Tax=Nocardia sp. NPDC058633 TaxID=3346568 RepID=UPI00365121ED
MNEDLRICFIGDSFVQGIGDPEYRGWVGRVLIATGPAITAFNLGIRRNTSADVVRRCWREVDPRILPAADNRLVISFGSNDAVIEDGTVRVGRTQCLRNLDTLLTESRERAIHPLVIGPPPVVDGGEEHLERTADLADGMAQLCATHDVPFVATTRELAADPTWIREAGEGDGAHPGNGGYQRLADLILGGPWHSWIARPTP